MLRNHMLRNHLLRNPRSTAFSRTSLILAASLLLATAAFADSNNNTAISDVLVDAAHHTLTINGVNLFGPDNSGTPPVVTLADSTAPLIVLPNPAPSPVSITVSGPVLARGRKLLAGLEPCEEKRQERG